MIIKSCPIKKMKSVLKVRESRLQTTFASSFVSASKNDDDVATLMKQSSHLKEYKRIDQDYFKLLLEGIVLSKDDLEKMITPHIDRPIDQIDSIERAIIWISVYEISNIDIPNSVAINEAIELAKSFGAETSFQYINAVLDSYCQSIKT